MKTGSYRVRRPPARHVSLGPRPSALAFTMIEIALSLAIIGFALVAIIGVLPRGMNAQKDTREETIIGQDAGVFINAIRNGAQGLDYLTNYVIAITNYVTGYDLNRRPTGFSETRWYTYSGSYPPGFPLTNGFNIVGLLSTPEYWPEPLLPARSGFQSNYVLAVFRSLSGPAVDKAPQQNADVLESAFHYMMLPEIVPYCGFDTNPPAADTNYWFALQSLQRDLHDLRLRMRWPWVTNLGTGQGRAVYRTLVGGVLTNYPVPYSQSGSPFFFFQPRTYVNAP